MLTHSHKMSKYPYTKRRIKIVRLKPDSPAIDRIWGLCQESPTTLFYEDVWLKPYYYMDSVDYAINWRNGSTRIIYWEENGEVKDVY